MFISSDDEYKSIRRVLHTDNLQISWIDLPLNGKPSINASNLYQEPTVFPSDIINLRCHIYFFADTGYWLWADNSSTEYLNGLDNCQKVNDSCVAITYSQGDGTIPDRKWIPVPCDKPLPFLCTIKKGIASQKNQIYRSSNKMIMYELKYFFHVYFFLS